MCPVVPAALATEPRYSYYRHTLTLTGSIVRATLIVLLTNSLCMVHAPFAAAQGVKPSAPPAYPSRVIRIVLPGSPGAGSDIIGRILAQPLSKTLGQNVVIDNRPGAAKIGRAHV